MNKVITSNYVTEITDEIERLFDNKPDGRKKSDLSHWKNEINQLIDRVNQLAKIKIYPKQ